MAKKIKSKHKTKAYRKLQKEKMIAAEKAKTPYQRYRDYAIGKYGISSKNVLDYSNYLTAMAESRIATRKGGA